MTDNLKIRQANDYTNQRMKMNVLRISVVISVIIIFFTVALNMLGKQGIIPSSEKQENFIPGHKRDNQSEQNIYRDNWKNTNRSLTVVTAFFDLGKFPKGSFSNMRTPDSYKSWMEVFKYLKNPLVIYTDSYKLVPYFKKLRQNAMFTTKVIIFSRDKLWSFQILQTIAKIYSKPGYPKHYPNTYIPEYTSMTHSKLPLVVKAIKSNNFPSDYYCWVDIGYFRELSNRKREFYLEVPTDFDDSKVGVTRVYDSDLKDKTAKSIILGNQNWIGGGFFLGRPEVIMRFESQYKKRVLYYLSRGLMNVEQHILYAMYTAGERRKNPITIEVQPYIPGTQKVIANDPWFYLGYLMYHETVDNTTIN